MGNADTFLKFFRICKMFHVTDYKQRVDILRKLVKRQELKYIRDGEQFIRGKRCLTIKSSQKFENG